jgi:hypothetical protein
MQVITNNPLLITIILSVIGLALLLYVGPMIMSWFSKEEQSNSESESEEVSPEIKEQFESETTSENDAPPAEALAQKIKGPYVDAQVGTIIDGPGFEKGEVSDLYKESDSNSIPSNYYFLDDGAGGEMSIQHNLCSKSCCSEQWPTPFKRKYDPYVCQNKDKFVASNLFCTNSFQDSGCLCLTKKQSQFIYNRGANGREWF